MSFLKFAYAEYAVIDAFTDEPKIDNNSEDARQAATQFRKTVIAAKQAITRSNDFLYVRTRAIGSLEKWGPNLNGDGFPYKELASSYETFRGKGNFLDHKSDDIRMIRGLVIDAFLNAADQCVECLIAVDRVSHPQLARHIETGVVNSVSMGTRVGFSNCSVCQNEAKTEDEYCAHIKNYKGLKFGALVNNAAHKFGKWPVHEVNHELEFIELSWVSVPAFKEANVLERIASVQNNNQTSLEKLSTLKEELIDNVKESEAEIEMLKFAATFHKNNIKVHHTQMVDPNSKATSKQELEGIPSNLVEINNRAQCLNDNECKTDIRNTNANLKEPKNMETKTAAGMQRIKITVDIISFRKGYNDFASEGTVTINEKEYPWWASSADKTKWSVSLDEDAVKLISAKGNTQIISAVEELLSKNVNDTELIIAKITANIMAKNAWMMGSQDEDPLLHRDIDEIAGEHGSKNVYDNKDLEVPNKVPVRETEKEKYDTTAKSGPSGENGKAKEIKENSSKEEDERHKMLQRGYLEYKLNLLKKS